MSLTGMKCELLEIPGAHNIRDLGGYDAGGKKIQKRRFIRAGALGEVPPDGVERFAQLGIRCVVDLRSTHEAQQLPDTVAGDSRFDHHHIPMLDYIQSSISSGDFTTFPRSMAEMYTGLLDKGQPQLAETFRVFADAEGGVLFHCTAGKDRTGIVAMLLLLLAGVAEEEVIEDYSWSEHLTPTYLQPEENVALPRYLFESKPETMRTAIDHLTEAYGGAEPYLSRIGIAGAELDRIRRKLLD